jgi:hypothetical protein
MINKCFFRQVMISMRGDFMNLELEWQALCDEREAARRPQFEAYSIVLTKSHTERGQSMRLNPTDFELDTFEKSSTVLAAIDRRMAAFVKAHP